ncbi:Thrombospondin type-1 domain-containing protein 1 [Bienertia sinuspersici]
MCYKAEFPLASLEELARARRFVFRPPPLLVGPTVNRAEARASERGERRKVCLCSLQDIQVLFDVGIIMQSMYGAA